MAEEKDETKEEKNPPAGGDKPEVVKEEEKAQEESEQGEKVTPTEEAAKPVDEEEQKVEEVEEGAGTKEVMPAEVAAVHEDTETVKAAETKPAKTKPFDKAQGKEEKPVASPEPKSEPTGEYKDVIKTIEGLTTVELVALVKDLEERFGVSGAMPVAAAPAAGAPGAPGAETEEKANYTIVLADSGAQKIAVIKAIRVINQELGLKDAKDLVDNPPKEIKKDVPKDEAQEAKKKLEAAGAKVELK